MTTKAGASLTTTPRLPSFFVTSQAVASVTSSVASARTSSTSGSTATGLKKCIPTTRSGCSSPAAIAATESEDVFVTSRHSGETTSSSAAKTCCLTAISSKTASITRSQPAKSSSAVDAGHDRAEEARLRLREPPARDLLLELGADRRDRLLDARRVDVRDHERHLEPAQEQRRELRRHQPRADDADPPRSAAAPRRECRRRA